MKFVKSNFSKKIIIVLVVLILFNAIYPDVSYAVDLGGILMQPIYWLLLGIYIPLDLLTGAVIWLKEFDWTTINNHTNDILGGSYGTSLSDWFVGPDTIFLR